MKNINLYTSWGKFQIAVKGVTKTGNRVNWIKEDMILNRLERTLGKTKEEVNNLLTKDLLSLLSLVPFTK